MIYFYVVGALAYVGVVNYASDRSRLRSALLWTAGVVAAEAAFALFLGGRWLDTGVVRVYGSFGEPVLFAGFMVPMSVLLLGWGMGSSTSAASPRWGAPVAFAGLLVSALAMSRAAWGLAILGVGFMVVVLWRWRQVRPMRLLAGVAAGGALAIAVMFFWVRFAPAWYSSFNYVFTDSEDQQGLAARLESESWLWRLDIAREVVRVVGEEPIIGHGTLTFGQTHDVPGRHSSTPADGWIPTASLLVLHDTGVVGLVLLGVFLLAIAFDAVGTIRSGGIEGRTVALGGLLGLVAWLGMEQLSTTMTLGIGWVFLGLVSAVASVYRASPPPETEVAPVDRPMSNAQ
jgi:hypothetical protein